MGRSGVFGLERRWKIGTMGLQCLEDCCEGRNVKPLPHVCGFGASGNEFEWYHKRKKLLVGMVKCEGECWEALVMSGISVAGVLCWEDQICVLGVGWRHLGVGSQTRWDFVCRRYGVTGSDKGLAGKNLVWWGWRRWMLPSHAWPGWWGKSWSALREGGNQSKSHVFDFLIHRFWEIRNHRSRWACWWCFYLWLLKCWWTLRIHSWQMLKGCKLLYSDFSRSMLSGKRSDF